MLNELDVLRAEYDRAINAPLFDNPAEYCILLDLIRNRIEILENEIMNKCDSCAATVTITLEPYGSSKMATIECPNCGVSYDTNLDEMDVK